jgi:hypothetical protein
VATEIKAAKEENFENNDDAKPTKKLKTVERASDVNVISSFNDSIKRATTVVFTNDTISQEYPSLFQSMPDNKRYYHLNVKILFPEPNLEAFMLMEQRSASHGA